MVSLLPFSSGLSRSLIAVVVAVTLVGLTSPVLAHDGQWTGEISGIGPDRAVEVIHQDAVPFLTNYMVTATNSGTVPWGDFHFGIYDPIGGQNISNIHFLDSSMGGVDPTSSQSPLTWVIDNVTVGARIDLYFYGDPVMPGETAWFQVFIDNPDQITFFGVLFYPTPEPPVGACCFEDGHCELLTEEQCLSAPGHTGFRGVGILCERENPCPQPGACCDLQTGACYFVLEQSCTPPLVWFGGPCLPQNPCPQPGACCDYSTGECYFLLEENCDSPMVFYGGPCEPSNPCPTPPHPGACCFMDGTCQVMIQVDCIRLGGLLWVLAEDCIDDCPPVPTRNSTWGEIKATYR